jgi:hypothetical protein
VVESLREDIRALHGKCSALEQALQEAKNAEKKATSDDSGSIQSGWHRRDWLIKLWQSQASTNDSKKR